VFRLARPTPVILSALNAHEAQILPKHLYEGTEITSNPHNIKPVGTGAFRFKEWNRGEYIALERNPDYWDRERPYLDKLIFRIIPDAGSRSAALETGEVQYAPYDPVSFSDFERLKAVPGLAVSTKGYEYQSQVLVTECNLRRGPTQNPQVRQAIAHAIDRKKLTDTVWYGIGKPATGPIPSTTTRFYTPDVPQYPYDKNKAAQLLDAAGFPLKGGTRFKLALSYMPFNETLRMSAEFVRQSLKEVGIDATIATGDTPSYSRKVYTNYDFDLNLGQFATFVDPDMGITRLFWSKAIKAGIPFTNASGYSNPEMDKIIEAEKQEPDLRRRVELFHRFQKLAQTDLPVIPLMELQHFTVYSNKVKGLSTAPDAALTSLKAVWLES
jgi:peptide/nickel transport system substrate-binding protein